MVVSPRLTISGFWGSEPAISLTVAGGLAPGTPGEPRCFGVGWVHENSPFGGAPEGDFPRDA